MDLKKSRVYKKNNNETILKTMNFTEKEEIIE
jgi:hypothetical protein